jgi:hypothetical protein
MLHSARNKRNGFIWLFDTIDEGSLSEGKVKVSQGGIVDVQSHYADREQEGRRRNCEVVGRWLYFVGGL